MANDGTHLSCCVSQPETNLRCSVSSSSAPDVTVHINRSSLCCHNPRSSSGECASPHCGGSKEDRLDKLLAANKIWSEQQRALDPQFFDRLCAMQSPEFMWIGCADSRVPANVIMGLLPGQVFVQRNVGNQATHTDLNCAACLEYAVKELKVKVIIVCGHYGCGAVKAALQMPSKMTSLVNCWISDIRECRNQHHAELRALDPAAQVDRLVELNVMRQTFNVCTSDVVQSAWDQGQQLEVYGVVYSLKDGLVNRLVGPLTHDTALTHKELIFERVDTSVGSEGAVRRMMRVSSTNTTLTSESSSLFPEEDLMPLYNTAVLNPSTLLG